jgi:nucleoside-diphosphate-sugar epimerase
MKIFVTGATGFIGSHFTELALTQGHEVIGSYTAERPEKSALMQSLRARGAQLEKVDILDAPNLQRLMAGCEAVCHIAGAFRESGVDDAYFHKVNVVGTRNVMLAAAAAGVRRFVFCGTAGIFGQRVPGIITERSPVQPFNAYESSKVDAEAEVRKLAAEHKMEYAIVRPSAVYGPRDERLVKLFKSAAKGKFPLFGKGEGRRHMIYVTDLADAFLRACTMPTAAAQEFIAAGPRAVPLHDMLDTLASVVGKKKVGPSLPLAPMLIAAAITEDVCKVIGVQPPIYRRRMDFYRNDASFDCSKAAQILGWKPAVDLAEGFAATHASYREQGWI